MSCSPCWYILSNCVSQASRPQSRCSRPCSPASRPDSRSSSPCSITSTACRPCASYFPCGVSVCTPCAVPCTPCRATCPSPTKRKEKISDFVGSGVGVADSKKSVNGKSKKSGKSDKGGKSTKKGKKIKKKGSDGETSEGGSRAKRKRNGGRKNKGNGKGKRGGKGNGNGKGGGNKNGNGGVGSGGRSSKEGLEGEPNKEVRLSSQGGTDKDVGTHDASVGGTDKQLVDVGVCTPRMPPCLCPNPYCPSNLRKGQSRSPYSYSFSQQERPNCYCRGYPEPCSCQRRQKLSGSDMVRGNAFQICSKCGKKKRPKKGGTIDGKRVTCCNSFYVKNENFTSQSCPPSCFEEAPANEGPVSCSHIITLLTQHNQMLAYHMCNLNELENGQCGK